MTVLTPTEQELFDHAKAALPDWYADDERANEFLGACAKIFGPIKELAKDWLTKQTRILQASGPTSTTPDWLNQHARDRGTTRQEGESDAALAERLRNVPDQITRPVLLDAVQKILAADGITDEAFMEELPRDGAYFGEYESFSGTGGTFSGPASGVMTFTPDEKFLVAPFRTVFPEWLYDLELSGADEAGNDGTFEVTGLSGNGALFVNGSGVAGVDAGVTWTIQKKDPEGNVLDGWTRAYWGRGYRFNSRLPTIIVILPYGTPEGTGRAVAEMLRQRKAGGVIRVVERRQVP